MIRQGNIFEMGRFRKTFPFFSHIKVSMDAQQGRIISEETKEVVNPCFVSRFFLFFYHIKIGQKEVFTKIQKLTEKDIPVINKLQFFKGGKAHGFNRGLIALSY